MVVHHVQTSIQYRHVIQESKNYAIENGIPHRVIIKYSASWCGPCKRIAPYYEAISEEYQDICFIEIDVEVLKVEGIDTYPTFRMYRDDQRIFKITGANKKKLREHVEKL